MIQNRVSASRPEPAYSTALQSQGLIRTMRRLLPALFCVALFGFQAHAHPGHPGPHGLAEGLAHPLGGLDHIIAMLAVGLWAGQLGGRAIWAMSLTFAGGMFLGAVLHWIGVVLPLVQAGIWVSGIVLGLLVASAARWPWRASVALVGCFALFHGYAHAAAVVPGSSLFAYGAGLLATTLLFQLTGSGVGWLVRRNDKAIVLRYAGACLALTGVCLWLAS